MTHKKALLVDLDGTLLDTAQDFLNAYTTLANRFDLPIPKLETLKRGLSGGIKGMLEVCLADPNDPRIPEFSPLFLAAYENNISESTQLYPGFDLIFDFIQEHHLRLAVVTNKLGYLAEKIIQNLKMQDRIDCIVGGDTAGRPKPYPDPLLYALKKINVAAKDAIYVGDAKRDIEAAQACQMRSLAAAYGYLNEEDNPHSWGADGVIHHASEILAWL